MPASVKPGLEPTLLLLLISLITLPRYARLVKTSYSCSIKFTVHCSPSSIGVGSLVHGPCVQSRTPRSVYSRLSNHSEPRLQVLNEEFVSKKKKNEKNKLTKLETKLLDLTDVKFVSVIKNIIWFYPFTDVRKAKFTQYLTLGRCKENPFAYYLGNNIIVFFIPRQI